MHADNEKTRQFAMLLTEHQGALRSFVVGLIPGHPNVLDLLQDINLIIWQKKDRFELGTNFRAWVFTIARHRIMNERKKLRRGDWLVFDDDVASALAREGPVEDQSPGWVEDRHQALERCIAKLRAKDRDLLEVRYTSKVEMERFAAEVGRSGGRAPR